MSIKLRNRVLTLVLGIVAVLLLTTTTLVAIRGPVQGASQMPREVLLVASSMEFSISDGSVNPTLRVAPGEWVEIVLVNRDAGMKHDVFIPELNLRSETISAGQRTVLRFVAPQQGELEYRCSFHPVTMRGVIEVGPP